jgi:hypothetical protein
MEDEQKKPKFRVKHAGKKEVKFDTKVKVRTFFKEDEEQQEALDVEENLVEEQESLLKKRTHSEAIPLPPMEEEQEKVFLPARFGRKGSAEGEKTRKIR